jgi:hypothetical protein
MLRDSNSQESTVRSKNMSRYLKRLPPELVAVLRLELLRLAKLEDDLAAAEAAKVPYWSPCPSSVGGHRAAAAALRFDADQIERAA